MERKVVCIVNGCRSLKPEVKRAMDVIVSIPDISMEVVVTERAKHATDIARRKAEEGVDFLVSVGGDGTCNEVVRGIMESGNISIGFGILPNGTGNDFHRMLGTFDSDRFVNALQENRMKKVDICALDQKGQRDYALNIAGIGFDGHVVKLLTSQREKWKMGGKIAYASAIVRAFFSYKKPTIQLESEAYTFKGKCLMLTMCNGTTFGHGLTMHPEARIDDGELSCTLFGEVSLLDYVRNLSRLKKGKFVDHKEVHYFNCKQLEIVGADHVLWGETDGELFQSDVNTSGRLTVRVLPKAINLLTPDY